MKFRDFFGGRNERPVRFVPRPVFILTILFLVIQIVTNSRLPGQSAIASALPEVPKMQVLNLVAFGDNAALAKYLMIWLQAFDNQPGVSIPFRQLDYSRLRDWLDAILQLDPLSNYPLLSASRVYSAVADNGRKRVMLDFVSEKFREDPVRRWPWMAHAVYVAKHQLRDPDLALSLAKQIRESVPPGSAPAWARQMEIYILEDMDEIESAKVLIGGLLESGQIKDKNELRYLKSKLEELENKATSN